MMTSQLLPPRPTGAATTQQVLAAIRAVSETFVESVGSEIDNREQQDLAAEALAVLARLYEKVEREGVEKR